MNPEQTEHNIEDHLKQFVLDCKLDTSNFDKILKNIELIIEKSPIYLSSTINEKFPKCKVHGKPLEMICIDHKERICTNCALFGEHKSHLIKPVEEIIQDELSVAKL